MMVELEESSAKTKNGLGVPAGKLLKVTDVTLFSEYLVFRSF